MTRGEYTELLDYLLQQLRAFDVSIVEEITRQINRGKTLTIKDVSDLRAKNIKQSEVGKTQTLPLTSKEAFEVAIDYLSKIIFDVPSYSKSISSAFGENVIWDYDQSQSIRSLSESTSTEFSLTTIKFNEGELSEAKEELQRIKSFISGDGNIQ